MAICTLYSIVSLILLAEVVHSKIHNVSHASFVVYQKLENALVTNHEVLYLLQEALFPSQGLNRGDWLDLATCVMVDSVQDEICEKSHFSGEQRNFTYCRNFEWSSSALVDLIPYDQLFVLDNVLGEVIFHLIQRRDFIYIPLHIDSLPCGTTEDDLRNALLRLLSWVCTYSVYLIKHFVYISHLTIYYNLLDIAIYHFRPLYKILFLKTCRFIICAFLFFMCR